MTIIAMVTIPVTVVTSPDQLVQLMTALTDIEVSARSSAPRTGEKPYVDEAGDAPILAGRRAPIRRVHRKYIDDLRGQV